MKRWIAVTLASVLVLLAPATSLANIAPGQQSRVIANLRMAPSGTTDVVGSVTADVHAPANWADAPGSYSFDGTGSGVYADLKHARGVIQRASFWPWVDDAKGAKANFAFLEGVQCLYFASQEPYCVDASWAFIDYFDPKIPDVQVSCWWTDGVRPAGLTGWDTCEPSLSPTTHQDWYDVVSGSLQVFLAP